MKEAATQILAERAREPDALRKTVGVSLGAHAVAIALLVFAPGSWLGGQEVETIDAVMSIRLGGPEGPGVGGATPLSGVPIQQVVPLPEARRPQWIQPPTPTRPKMVEPAPEAPRREEPETEVETTPDEARGRQPTLGQEIREGLAMADTGVEGIGLGLSTGGLGGRGGEINLSDFCCPEYLATMVSLIQQRWDSNQPVPGRSVVRFTVRRGGAIEEVGVQRSSGYVALDMGAQRAVLLTRQLPPLPSAFPGENLTVRLTFEYQP